MSSSVILRPAERGDIQRMSLNANAANASSAIHQRIAPWQDDCPLGYYQWRRNVIRQRFATPNLRTMVAVDSESGEILGQAAWAVEGPDTALYKEWTSEWSWTDWIESKLIKSEQRWARIFTDRCIDYTFLDGFLAGFLGDGHAPRPPCLHLHMITVEPGIQARGVGRMLVDWGKEVAVRYGLPVYLESALEAVGFYEKTDFVRMREDMVVDVRGEKFIVPVYVWEGKGREGQWLKRDEGDGVGQRWTWREDVLPV